MIFRFTEAQRREAYRLIMQICSACKYSPADFSTTDAFLDNFNWLDSVEDARQLKLEMDNTPYQILES